MHHSGAKQQFLVLGAGSWGNALAILLANNGHQVTLWAHTEAQAEIMRTTRSNPRYLPGIPFPDNLHISSVLAESLGHAQHVLCATPSHAFVETLHLLAPHWRPDMSFIWATKGLDPASQDFLHVWVKRILGESTRLAMLTGPSFAKEVANGQPTAVVLATEDLAFARTLQPYFHAPHFRTYLSQDIIGAQLGGAIKNVLAISVGIADGLGYGANTRAALITRGLAEMTRLGVAMGAKAETFTGLSGVGDLILTCTDNQSRNRRFGIYLGQGKSRHQAEHEVGQVVEGIQTTETVHRLAQRLNVYMPITEHMYRLLHQEAPASEVVLSLLSRNAGLEL